MEAARIPIETDEEVELNGMASAELEDLAELGVVAELIDTDDLVDDAADGEDDTNLDDDLEEPDPNDIKALLDNPEVLEEDDLDLNLEPDANTTTDSFQLFLNEAGKYKLLAAYQEVQLSKTIMASAAAQARLDEIREILSAGELELDPTLEPEEAEYILSLKAIASEGLMAKKQMVNCNLRLVVSIVKKYQTQGMTLGDLTNEGVIGLVRATEKFDWRKGFRFSTYATWWIRQAVQRAIANKARAVRIPVHVVERETKLKRAERRLTQKNGRVPTREEIAQEAGVPMDKANEVWDAGRTVTSLDQPVGDDGGDNYGSLFEDTEALDPVEEADQSLRHQAIRQAVQQLPERQRKVIEARFGLEDPPQSLDAIGRDMDITREGVRYIEKEAMKKLHSQTAGIMQPGNASSEYIGEPSAPEKRGPQLIVTLANGETITLRQIYYDVWSVLRVGRDNVKLVVKELSLSDSAAKSRMAVLYKLIGVNNRFQAVEKFALVQEIKIHAEEESV